MDDETRQIELHPSRSRATLRRADIHETYPYADLARYGSEEDGGAAAGPDFAAYLRPLRRHKVLITVITLIGVALTAAWVTRIKSRYMAEAIVEIGREGNIASTADQLLSGGSEANAQTIDSKKYILELTSEPVLEKVARDLNLDQNPRFADVNRVNSPGEMLALVGSLTGVADSSPHPETASSQSGASASVVNGPPSAGEAVGVLRENLVAAQVKETRALRIAFTHTDPEISAAVANGLAEALVERNYENVTAQYARTSEWLERTTHELKARAEKAENALADYTEGNNIYGTTNLTGDNLTRIHDLAMKAETDRMLKEAQWREVSAGRLGELPEAFVDPRATELARRLGELEVTLAQLSVKFGDDHPSVRESKNQIAEIEQQLRASSVSLEARLKADYDRALREELSLTAAFERAKEEAARQNQMATTVNILKQEVDTATGLYTDFLKKTSEAKVRLAEQHNNLRVIAPAQTPSEAISPNRGRSLLLALIASLLVAAAIAFVIDYFDPTIKNVEDVARYLQLPALGIIPAMPRATEVSRLVGPTLESPGGAEAGTAEVFNPSYTAGGRSSIAEAYRTLRTSVLLAAAEVPPKTILFTSGRPGEGKTTTAINSAISLAQLRKAVIVVDCDLRKPRRFKTAGEDASIGLSTYLAEDIALDEIVRRSKSGYLSFLPAGPVPENPAELLSSEKMKALIAELARNYDFVILDSPPLVCATDSVVLSTLVDGVLLVVQGGKSNRQTTRHAQQELESVGATIFGVVLNNVDLQRDGYEGYYYSRYYDEYAADQARAQAG